MLEILLENQFGKIEQYDLGKDLKGLRFNHKKGQGSVSLYGGQVLSWQPLGEQPVFWLSKDSQYAEGQAIRGGIPLCWPWFGGEVKQPSGEILSVSNHGFARQSQWQVIDLKISPAVVEIELLLEGNNLSPLWSTAFELKQTIVFGETFKQTLSMKNLSEQPVEYTGALHSYFCVGQSSQTEIPALNGVYFQDKLSSAINGNDGNISVLKSCEGPIDRIYHTSDTMTIIDKKWQREIEVSSEGCQQWVLWNPGKEAKTMTDVHQAGEREFVCLEAANTRWKTIASNDVVSISQIVKVYNKE